MCDRVGCVTRLSIYNKTEFCYPHRPRKRPRVRGYEPPEHIPRCSKCAARARGHMKDFMEIEVAAVIHREGTEGRAILCEGSVSTHLSNGNL